MSDFHLQIVTPDGVFFDGTAQKVIVKTTEGDVGILARHADFLSPIGIGRAKIYDSEGKVREAACVGGLVSVTKDVTRIVATTFEWADMIDIDRAKRAADKAQQRLDSKKSDMDIKLAELKLKRALNRISVYNDK